MLPFDNHCYCFDTVVVFSLKMFEVYGIIALTTQNDASEIRDT